MYIQWTKVDSTLIEGVQGRYFLPLILLVPLLFVQTTQKSPKKSKSTSAKSSKAKSSKLEQLVSKLPTTLENRYMYIFLAFESIYALTAIVCFHI